MASDATGRVPPHNVEAEESLLGAMLLGNSAIEAAVGADMTASDFYVPRNGVIYEAIVAGWASSGECDPVIVAESLRRDGALDRVGGQAYLATLQANTPAIGNGASYIRIVREHHALRRLIEIAAEIEYIGYSAPADVASAVADAEAALAAVMPKGSEATLIPVREMMEACLDAVEAIAERGEAVTGLPTGFVEIDALTLGLQPSSLYVLGGRPSSGKSALVFGIAVNAAVDSNKPVLVFSLEMNHLELAQRMISMRGKVDASRLRSGRLSEADWPNVSRAVGRLADAQMWVDDDPLVTIAEMRSRSRQIHSRIKLGLVVVDYIQLLAANVKAKDTQEAVSMASRSLKILARELECPVVALSQLSRDVEHRADKRPVLADLRASGSLEQDADAVMLLYRPEMYDPNSPDRGTAEVIVAKQRNGPTGTCRLAFLDRYVRFANMAAV